jgi:hypothetical protein
MMLLAAFVLACLYSSGTSFTFTRRINTRATSTALHAGTFFTHYEELAVQTGRTICLRDITPTVADIVSKTGMKEGVVTVLSKHSTVGVCIQGDPPPFPHGTLPVASSCASLPLHFPPPHPPTEHIHSNRV